MPRTTVILLLLAAALLLADAARYSIKKKDKSEDLCARMHNNTALEGVDPMEMLQATAFECQKKCVDMFPHCSAVVYYYLFNETKHHYCYLFEKNSVHEKVELVEQKAEHKKDLVRMLEIVESCHQFDAHPPLEEDGLASSTDKVDRKKRQNGDEAHVNGVGDWTDWSACSTTGHAVRTQACEYGRKIQRRGCAARQYPQRAPAPPAPQPQPQPQAPPQPDPRQQQYLQQQQLHLQQQQQQHQQRLQQQQEQAQIPQQPERQPQRSPYDQQALLYQQRMQQYRENQRHPAVAQAVPCVGNFCEDPRLRQQQPAPQPPQPEQPRIAPTYVPAPVSRPGYRPAAPPPPACNGEGCEAQLIVVGQWHDWSEWSDCSCTCGDGLKQRRRECATNNCQGPEYEQANCNMGPCQTWSEWCEWSTCSGSCGQGQKSRTRFCHLGTGRCDGSDYEAEPCDAGPCPEWTEWEDWTQCSASCGAGIAQRQRTCLGGIHGDVCPGPRSEQRACESGPCATWADWQEWSGCSASCGDGMKRRQRVCQFGTDCAGPTEETQFCYGPPCAVWTEWCEWSHCSAQCGPGQRTRTRGCLTSDGQESRDCQGTSLETTLCEGTNCCRWSDWCHWSMCDKECGGGQSMRTRTCMRDGAGADDSCRCDGPDRENRECNTQSCAPQCQWTTWCAWSDCSTQSACEVGIQSRSRQCVGELGCHCFGLADESQQCRGQTPCPNPPPC